MYFNTFHYCLKIIGDSAYVYFSPTQAQVGQTGQLVSPKIAGMSKQHCLDIDYVLHNDPTQKLRIDVLKEDGRTQTLETLAGTGSASWTHYKRTLNDTEVGNNFQVSIIVNKLMTFFFPIFLFFFF